MRGKQALLLLASLACGAGDPLVQSLRPPQQTWIQNQAQAALVANARDQSEAARSWVLNYLGSEVAKGLEGTYLASLSAADLLARLDWEFQRLPLFHNAPSSRYEQPWVTDDSDLDATIGSGYLHNVCQRYTIGAANEAQETVTNLHWIMSQHMALPPFANEQEPTLREANSCVMYLANNLRKTHCGNFMYGSVTYVVNFIYKDKFAVAPYDSGKYQDLSFGTLEDYYHLFKAHVTTLNYNFAEVFKRWYIAGTPPPNLGDLPYFEVEWLGNAWFPESMLYVIVKYSDSDGKALGLWGKELGRKLQDTMRYRGRPVIWADGDDSGMLIDGTVNMIQGGRLGQEASDYFTSNWNSGVSWEDFYRNSPENLKFFFPQYERRKLCEDIEQDPNNMVMGHDRLGNCVYWTWWSYPTKWECLNDGTCERSDSDRAIYFSEEGCLQSCGQGKWGCISNVPDSRPGTHYCIPYPTGGQCSDADSCEAQCSAKTLGNASAAPWAAETYV